MGFESWPRTARGSVCFVVVSSVLVSAACAGPEPEEDGGPLPGKNLPVTRLTPLDEDDGFLGRGESVSPFDEEHPAVVSLEPELREAVRDAATHARADGVEMTVTSGWRSRRYQRFLLESAITTYGSEEEARRWVSTPEESSHVTGDAVDIGPTDATSWLSRHGAAYGLCRTYANEMWHYELAVGPGETCPDQISDASAG